MTGKGLKSATTDEETDFQVELRDAHNNVVDDASNVDVVVKSSDGSTVVDTKMTKADNGVLSKNDWCDLFVYFYCD